MNRKGFVLLFIVVCISILWFSMEKANRASPFGVCVDVDECKDPNIVHLIKWSGIKWTRQVFYLNLIEPENGKFDWKKADAAVENMYKNGINAYGMFLMWKTWCNPVTGDDESIKAWTDFVASVISRYKDRIKYWEVWNEPDCEMFWKPMNASNYVKLLKATYITAKKIDPDCKIILGGVMGWGGKYTYFTFIDDVYNNGGKGYFDIMAIHPYTMPDDPNKDNLLRRKIDDAIDRMRKNNDGDKPIWITEIGWPSNKLVDPASERGVTPDEQAKYLVEAFKICLSYPQIKKVFWYGFRDVGVYPFDSEHHYGLIKNNFVLKPSYKAYKEFISKWKQ